MMGDAGAHAGLSSTSKQYLRGVRAYFAGHKADAVKDLTRGPESCQRSNEKLPRKGGGAARAARTLEAGGL